MLPTTPQSLLPLVLQSMAGTTDPRLAELLAALVRHLHAFALETRLSEEEFEQALAFVVAIGQATGEKKNEVVLLADLLGVSSLVALA
ncbi:MAG TPA: dioxygenase, partial [Ideonella sp.]|nr:dioxygenase [Ideonella sp.]